MSANQMSSPMNSILHICTRLTLPSVNIGSVINYDSFHERWRRAVLEANNKFFLLWPNNSGQKWDKNKRVNFHRKLRERRKWRIRNRIIRIDRSGWIIIVVHRVVGCTCWWISCWRGRKRPIITWNKNISRLSDTCNSTHPSMDWKSSLDQTYFHERDRVSHPL